MFSSSPFEAAAACREKTEENKAGVTAEGDREKGGGETDIKKSHRGIEAGREGKKKAISCPTSLARQRPYYGIRLPEKSLLEEK